MSIKCGSCKGRHESVIEVRMCHGDHRAVATIDKPAKPEWTTEDEDALWRRVNEADDRRAAAEQRKYAVTPAERERNQFNRTAPQAKVNRPTEDQHAGMYRHPETGQIFKVQKAVHGSGHLYAKELLKDADGGASFEIARGMIFKIDLSWRMTLEQAKEYGALYGVCCVCGRTLTNETSIEDGIGPICASKV